MYNQILFCCTMYARTNKYIECINHLVISVGREIRTERESRHVNVKSIFSKKYKKTAVVSHDSERNCKDKLLSLTVTTVK